MRTTIRLDDSLLRDAKALAARQGRTLTSLIEDGLREQRLGVTFSALDAPAALAAGEAWATYRRGGGPRDRVIADFLIGAHASTGADRLLTRDRGFYRGYFEAVVLVDPTAA